MSYAPPKGKFKCLDCESTEEKCHCDRYCVHCQSQIDIRLCDDGLYYCFPCRDACGYKTDGTPAPAKY
jgi:hypothetical protein